MKKLVIGASGHIGAHLVRALLAEKYNVKVLVRNTSNMKGIAGLDVEIVYGDVLDPDSLKKAMTGCDAVFHLGAPTSLGPTTSKVIIDGTKCVLEEAYRLKINKLIYTSSVVTVGYTSDPNVILDETSSQFLPASSYHTAKYRAEGLVLDFSQKTGLPVVIVNPATVVGPLDYRVTPSNMPIQQCVDRGLPFVFDSGVTIVHAEDVARGHVLAYLYGKSGQRYILGGDRMTIREYFRLICKLCQRPQPSFKIPRWAMLVIGAAFSLLQQAGVKKVPFNYSQAINLVGKYGFYSSQKAVRELGYSWRCAEDAIGSYVAWSNPSRSDRQYGGQTPMSADKNAKFFLEEHKNYRAQVGSIDTYASISLALSKKLTGIQRLLDIGNGGVFDYDTSHVGEITGLDLFLDDLPEDIRLPQNVTMIQGSALDIPENLHDFDGVVMVMLIHHLVGKTVKDCLANTQQLLSEARRVLRPGGRLVIMESCVPSWFFFLEKILFPPATFFIEKTMKHPSTLQYSPDFLLEMIEKAGFAEVKKEYIPKGKYVLQYGVKVPSWVTPVQPVLYSAVRS
jgi:dihydroflavonol-4-reductase